MFSQQKLTYYANYIPDPYIRQNTFLKEEPQLDPLPSFERSRALLPQPSWKGHDSAMDCYWKVWEIAFRNLRQPTRKNGFASPYIDTAFNGNLFMWDSAFILLFARYGKRAFNFQRTLDNFYAKQHPDGFICREIRESDGTDTFTRFDPSATGPNVMPWTEWEYYLNYGDQERLAKVFPPLLAFHHWFRRYRTWPDGTYWASGWACGMDNQPRLLIPEEDQAVRYPLEWWGNGHMAWIDTCLQAVFSAQILTKMAKALSREPEVNNLQKEVQQLKGVINRTMWDEATGFYYDRFANGELSNVKTIGAYWALLADILPPGNLERFIAHLENSREFNRPHRVPSLSADHPDYSPEGSYWLGSVWAPTNYMILRGLTQAGLDGLAYEIGFNHLQNVVSVFEQTGTVWENYAPEIAASQNTARNNPGEWTDLPPEMVRELERIRKIRENCKPGRPTPGNIARDDFVGWTGLPPVAVLFEYVFGLRPDVPANRLVWDIHLIDEHGIKGYPYGENGLLDLHCQARSSTWEQPVVSLLSNVPVVVEMRWEGGVETRQIPAS